MPDRMKRAHLKRAKEQYDDPATETPGEFSEYLQGQYTQEYGKENPKTNANKKVVDRYKSYLADTRSGDKKDRPGLLRYAQTEDKGPYPENKEEDSHLVEQIMKFLHSEQIQGSVAKQLKGDPKSVVKSVSEISANLSLKLVSEVRKQREVSEEAETAILTIVTEDLWTIAKSMGMKRVPEEVVRNSVRVAAGMYNQMEDKMKTAQTEQTKPVEGMGGQEQPQEQPSQEQPPPQEGAV